MHLQCHMSSNLLDKNKPKMQQDGGNIPDKENSKYKDQEI